MPFDPAILVLLALGAGGAVAWAHARQVAAVEREALRGAAETLGVEWRPSWVDLTGGSLRGSIDGFDVEVRAGQRGRRQWDGDRDWQRTTIYVVRGIPAGVRLARQTFTQDIVQLLTGADLQTGDDGFDRGVIVVGEERSMRAALDAPTRAAVHEVLTQPTASVIGGGEIRVDVAVVASAPGDVVRRVRELVALARRLRVLPSEISPRLATQATRDPVPGVRRHALACLHQHFRGEVVTGAVRAALADPSPEVRAVAARLAGEPGALLAQVRDRGVPPELRAECLHALAICEERALGRPALPDLLADAAPLVRQAALRHAALLDPALAREALPAWRDPPEAAERVALADGLARLRDPAAEQRLVALLGDDDGAVRLAAVRALGEVGTLASVAALLPHARGLSGLSQVGELAETAIRRIRGRSGGGEAGWVALAETQGGELTVAAPGGELALPKRQA